MSRERFDTRRIAGPRGAERTRADEKTYPDVGGGFVEPHERGDGIDWNETYPYKGTETTLAAELERGHVGAGGELERSELGGSSGAARRSRGGNSEPPPLDHRVGTFANFVNDKPITLDALRAVVDALGVAPSEPRSPWLVPRPFEPVEPREILWPFGWEGPAR